MKRISKSDHDIQDEKLSSKLSPEKKRTKIVNGMEISDRIPDALLPLLLLDKKVSSSLAICAGNQSVLPSLRPHMKALEISCHGVPWLAGCLIILFLSRDSSSQNIFANLLIALLADCLFVAIIKAIFRRGRPSENHEDMFVTVSIDAYSFPSGHASRAVLVFCLLAYKCDFSIVLCWLIALWSLAVCISRVLLGRHHVGDIIGGILLGYLEYKFMEAIWLSPDTINNFMWIFFDYDTSEP